MKKKDLEEALDKAKQKAARYEKLYVDEQSKSNELRAERAVNATPALEVASFAALLSAVASRIEVEIRHAASNPERQWDLVQIRKALRALGA